MLSRTAYAAIPAPKDIPIDNVAEPKNNPSLDAAVVTLIIPKLILPAIANIVDAPKNNDVLKAAPTNAPEKKPLQNESPSATADKPPKTPPNNAPEIIAAIKLKNNVPLGSTFITGLLPQ